MAVHIVDVLGSHLTKIADAFNAERKANLVALGGAFTSFHGDAGEVAVTAANASGLATSLTLVNQIRNVYETHRADAIAHLAADGTNTIAAPEATTLGTAETLANELKADFNAHRTQAGRHYNSDSSNVIAADDATDQTTLNTLLNELKADINLHLAGASTSYGLRIVAL